MAKHILLEEFHISVTMPPRLPAAEYAVVRAALDQRRFRRRLKRAIRAVFRGRLAPVRVKLSR